MKLLNRLALLSIFVLLLAGCATQSSNTNTSNNKDMDREHAAELQVQMAQGYMQKNELDIAQKKLNRALALNERSADAHTLQAVLNERLRRESAAERSYRRALELKPEEGGANNNLAWFLCRQGKYTEAERYFRRALDDPFYKTPELAAANAGACAVEAQKYEVAKTYLRQALSVNPQHPVALLAMAKVSARTGEFMAGRAFLQRFQSLGLNDPRALLLGIKIEEGNQNPEGAAEYRAQLSSRFPDYPIQP